MRLRILVVAFLFGVFVIAAQGQRPAKRRNGDDGYRGGYRGGSNVTVTVNGHHPYRDRGDYDDDDGRPPGWSHGRKVGWRGCDLPPGQAKKQGCYGGRRYGYRTRRSGSRVVYNGPHGSAEVSIPHRDR